MQNRKILLDTETTGFYYNKGDKIVEIAAIELFDDQHLGKSFHYYLNPQREIPYDSIKIHGITNEKVANCKIFAEIAVDFLQFVGDSKIIAHNANFDRDFINEELKNSNQQTIENNRFIDTLDMARKKFATNRGNSLDDLCKKFSISLESRKDFHGALIDVELLAKVYYHLILGQNNIFNDSKENYDNSKLFNQKEDNLIKYDASYFSYRSFNLLENEVNLHNDFLNKIKNHMWEN